MAKDIPLAATGRGLVAGAAGTAVMTAWQELSTKLQSSGDGGDPSGDREQPAGQEGDPWEGAPMPAQVARKILAGLFGIEVPAGRIGLLANVMHWGYGTAWGSVYGLIHGTHPGPALRRGLLFGAGVWTASYLQLVPMGLYEPPWKYPPKQLAMDLSYHLAYGIGVGAGYAALDR